MEENFPTNNGGASEGNSEQSSQESYSSNLDNELPVAIQSQSADIPAGVFPSSQLTMTLPGYVSGNVHHLLVQHHALVQHNASLQPPRALLQAFQAAYISPQQPVGHHLLPPPFSISETQEGYNNRRTMIVVSDLGLRHAHGDHHHRQNNQPQVGVRQEQVQNPGGQDTIAVPGRHRRVRSNEREERHPPNPKILENTLTPEQAHVRSPERIVERLDRQVHRLNHTNRELELRIQQLQHTTYNGRFIWKIPEVSRRRREAVDSALYSAPFYTSRYGYKMCIRAYFNGDGTRISFYFVIMRGEYDALLPWPFRQRVTLSLLDQTRQENRTDTFQPDPQNSSRPGSDMNVASGCPLFTRMTVLDDPRFVVDNTLFLRVVVDTTGLEDMP